MRLWIVSLLLLACQLSQAQNDTSDLRLSNDRELVKFIGADYSHLYCVEGSVSDQKLEIAKCNCNITECITPKRYLVLTDGKKIPFASEKDVVRCSHTLVGGGGYTLSLVKGYSVLKVERTQ